MVKTNLALRNFTRVHGQALALLICLIASVPIVVCMPLTSDTVLFDLQARTVLDGGVLYRDVLEPNLPGVVWIHLLLRSVVGWSSEAMRICDLVLVGSACWLLARLATRSGISANGCPSEGTRFRWTSRELLPLLFMAFFYLSRNEWCHCQRDSWMLLPVALALTVHAAGTADTRFNRVAFRSAKVAWLLRSNDQHSASRCAAYGRGLSLIEGWLWGAAFWIKPHVAVSVLALFLFELIAAENRRTLLRQQLWVIGGGLLAAVPGIAWMIQTEAWAPFWEMQLNWNPEYLRSGRTRRTAERLWYMLVRFHPWWIIHCLAIPAAVIRCRDRIRKINPAPECSSRAQDRYPVLVSVVYLSWLIQVCILQHAMDYVQVPPIILGIAVLASGMPSVPIAVKRPALIAAAFLALIGSPQLWPERLSLWTDCLRQGSAWSLKPTLAQGRFPDWNHLHRVVDYLANQNVRTGDVTCFNVHSIHLYEALQIRPATRYLGISVLLELFPQHRDAMVRTIQSSGHRFVVTDSDEAAMRPQEFPWDLPVVFQSGNFRVHRANGSDSADIADSVRNRKLALIPHSAQ